MPARPLHRVSSLVLSSPDTCVKAGPKELQASSSAEVIPDSEEERMHRKIGHSNVHVGMEVIEIFSSDEEEDTSAPRQSSTAGGVEDLFSVGRPTGTTLPGGWPGSPETDSDDDAPPTRSLASPRKGPKTPSRARARARRVIESSSEGSEDEGMSHPSRVLPGREPEVIELSSDSSPERQITPKPRETSKPKPARRKLPVRNVSPEYIIPLFIDDSDDEDGANEQEPWEVNDGAILTLDEPSSSRKPVRRVAPTAASTSGSSDAVPSTPRKTKGTSDASGEITLTADPTPIGTPSLTRSRATSSPTKSKAKTPRTTKKSQAAAEQARRESYAQALFIELNKVIFGDGLPKETKLNWSKRLLSTAGRAKWHRSREGVHTTEIELAVKVLDCDERIRNTLSHEMCHLACWIINGDPKEGHGKVFKAWAAKVMRKRPDIEVTTKHNYEISYPYEWECEQCSKIYGRFSKSIRPDECVCGACKVGKLVPLFNAPQRAPKTKANSRMASGTPQGSPHALPRPPPATKGNVVYSTWLDSDDEDVDVGALTRALGGVTIDALVEGP